MKTSLLPILLSIAAPLWTNSQKPIRLTSPNKNIVFNFQLIHRIPYYSLNFKGRSIIENSALGLVFDTQQFDHELAIEKPVFKDSSENYELVTGKTSKVDLQHLKADTVMDMSALVEYPEKIYIGITEAALLNYAGSAFTLYEKWEIRGLMVDFLYRDDQEMVLMQERILQSAALHHLHIQFQGAYKPTGLNRTYPNEFTREATLNYRADKWNDNGINPDHDINMPITRMLAGSTDYHLGGFRAVPPSKFKVQYTRPLVLGTRCHMLGMYVVLENYLGMVCDYRGAYENERGFGFIKEVPTVWDQTKVLEASVGEFIIIASKKNDTWYVGGINNHKARQVNIDMGFLKKGNHSITLYSHATNTDPEPNKIEKKETSAADRLSIDLASGGGVAMIIKD